MQDVLEEAWLVFESLTARGKMEGVEITPGDLWDLSQEHTRTHNVLSMISLTMTDIQQPHSGLSSLPVVVDKLKIDFESTERMV